MGHPWEPYFASIEEEVPRLFQELVAGLPAGCATLKIGRTEEPYPDEDTDGLRVELTPSRSDAAPVVLWAKNGNIHVYLALGAAAHHEIYQPNRRRRSVIEQIREVCEAVIQGHLEETVWYLGSKLIKSDARLHLRDKTERLYWIDGLYLFRRKTKKHIMYAPYIAPVPG